MRGEPKHVVDAWRVIYLQRDAIEAGRLYASARGNLSVRARRRINAWDAMTPEQKDAEYARRVEAIQISLHFERIRRGS